MSENQPSKPLSQPEGRIPVLDGFRGYAALWVVLGHISNFTELHIPLVSRPNVAVDVFMLMSGFLMAQHFLQRENREPWDSARTVLAFYIRRFFRIAPLYYIVLIPALAWHSPLRSGLSALNAGILTGNVYDPTITALTPINILSHITFLFGLFPQYCYSLVIPDWSIGLEMQFYFVFPFIMRMARKYGLIMFTLGSFVVWRVSNDLIATYVTNPPKVFGGFPQPSFLPLKFIFFAVGILLAWSYMDAAKQKVLMLLALALAGLSSSVVVILVTLTLALLLLGADEGPFLVIVRNVLANRFTIFLAESSYGVYLVHMLVLIPVIDKIKIQSHPMRFCAVAVLVIPVSYGLSWALSLLVEQRGILAGKYLVAQLARR